MRVFKLTKEIEQRIIEVCRTAPSMRAAHTILKMNHNTFKKVAIKLGCYKPNQNDKNNHNQYCHPKYKLEDILTGKVSYCNSHTLKNRLIKAKIKERKCESCKLDTWLGEPIPIELHHIDGDHGNNKLPNIQILCPNCHALTDNYRGKHTTKQNGTL